MSITRDIADALEQRPKDVRAVYDALVEKVQEELKENRRCRLPGLGVIAIRFKPARPKRKGKSPFTGEPMTFKAKPAENKLKFRAGKDLKNFVNKLPKVAPKKKRK